MTPPADAVFNGRYELRNQIACGGTAEVYLACDLLLDRPVALKVLIPELSTDHSFVERFRREAQAAANLSHPNIVPVFDWGESEHTYFIVMEYVDGEPLSSIIRTEAPLDPSQAASIAADIAKALSYAHRHGVVHRDVKPGNVLITADGQVKVTDFGIARAIGADEQVTQSGLVMGTATYFSPEQAQGFGVDGRSDVYSLGVVLYEMASGRTPFTGETPVAIVYQHVREQPPMPRSVNASIPVALEAIILQAMAKLPAERYATAEDMRADLERFVRGQTVLAKIPSDVVSGPITTVIPRTPGPGETTAVGVTEWDGGHTSTTRWWVAGGVTLLIALGLIIYFGGRSLGYFGGGSFTTVPSVTGELQQTATQKLSAAGLTAKITPVNATSANDQGRVISQDPTPPGRIKQGGVVTLDVGKNLPTTTVPPVTGLQLGAAEQQLQQAGFKVTLKPQKQNDPNQVQNNVIKQNPAGNVSATQGSKVILTYISGTKNVPVPNLANDSQASAGIALAQANLKLGTVTPTYSASVPNGSVISSTPPAGTSVPVGSSVSFMVSEGAGVTVPSLTGDSETQAVSALQGLGLTPEIGRVLGTTDPADIGLVVAQDPLPGAQVPPGTGVKIRIGVCGTQCQSTSTTTSTLPGTPPTVPTSSSIP